MLNIEKDFFSKLLDDIELSPNEIDQINSILLKSLNQSSLEEINLFNQQIRNLYKDNTSFDKFKILNLIYNDLDLQLLSNIMKKISKNEKLITIIQDIFFEKLLN